MRNVTPSDQAQESGQSRPEPHFPDRCAVPAECKICGLFVGYFVNEKNRDNALRAHRNVRGCKPKKGS